jgi:hypothetical protein
MLRCLVLCYAMLCYDALILWVLWVSYAMLGYAHALYAALYYVCCAVGCVLSTLWLHGLCLRP